jgi:hypothetical protein
MVERGCESAVGHFVPIVLILPREEVPMSQSLLFSVSVDETCFPRLVKPRVCRDGFHIEYGIYSLEFANVLSLTEARLVESSFQVTPCNGSCRNPCSYDLRGAIMRELEVFGENFDNRSPVDIWKDFEASGLRDFGHKLKTHGRQYLYVLLDDGDSDYSLICDGSLHVRRECGEFGTGDSYKVIGCCDRTCKPRHVRLPPQVARWVQGQLPAVYAAVAWT